MPARKLIAAILILVASLANAPNVRAETWRHRRCTYQGLERAHWTDREVRKTIRCAVDHWRVPGGRSKALAVAACESGYEADAESPTGSRGVYQFISSTWRSVTHRWREFRRRWEVPPRVWNGRSNVLLAIRLAHTKARWDPWACA